MKSICNNAFDLILAVALIFVVTAATLPNPIAGSWKILEVHKADGLENIRSAKMVMTFGSKAEGKRMQVTSDCRGLEFSQSYSTGTDGQLFLKGEQLDLIRTTEIRPCDLKISTKKKLLLTELNKLSEGEVLNYSFSKKGNILILTGEGFSLKLKKVK